MGWKIKIEGENDAPTIETYDNILVGYVDFDLSAYSSDAEESIYADTEGLDGYVYAYDPESYDDWTWAIEYHDVSSDGGYHQFGDYGTFTFYENGDYTYQVDYYNIYNYSNVSDGDILS